MLSVQEHNAEARAVWEAFNAGHPIRPPVMVVTGTQFLIFNDDLNPGEAVTFETYSTDADTMLDFQLRAAAWRAEHIAPYCDDPVGMPPNREAWLVRVDLQNYDEAAHLGAPVIFLPHQVPDTQPIFPRRCTWRRRLKSGPRLTRFWRRPFIPVACKSKSRRTCP